MTRWSFLQMILGMLIPIVLLLAIAGIVAILTHPILFMASIISLFSPVKRGKRRKRGQNEGKIPCCSRSNSQRGSECAPYQQEGKSICPSNTRKLGTKRRTYG